MTAMPVAERMTAEEFLARPYHPQHRWERLIDGELVNDSPLLAHQQTGGNILFALATWTHAEAGRGLALMSLPFVLGHHDVYEPDVHWHRAERAPARDEEPPYPFPDLVVEIRSPGTWVYDIGHKKARYEAAGVPELWLVDTASESVIVLRRSAPEAPEFDLAFEPAGDETLTSPLLPGFALPLATVFGE